MLVRRKYNKQFFDEGYHQEEQIPRHFTITFNEGRNGNKDSVKVVLDNSIILGNGSDDNVYRKDYYRYHGLIHYSFATLLGWSPCTRAIMGRIRKSGGQLAEFEDGAKARTMEEALALVIFNEAKRKDYFKDTSRITLATLKMIKGMTEDYEVSIRTPKEWQQAILQSFKIFRLLIENGGGTVEFDAVNKEMSYSRFTIPHESL